MSGLQTWVHWLDVGVGARWVRRIALGVAVFLLSLVLGYKQFHGATSEWTLAQADLAWQLSEGEGFTTRVNHARTAAWLKERGQPIFAAEAHPDLEQAPLYPLVLAGVMALLPDAVQADLFRTPGTAPNGFGGDYLLLVVNVLLFWWAAWLVYRLGVRLFDERVGLIGAGGMLVSTGLWQRVLALGGVVLAMVLVLLLVHALARARAAVVAGAHGRRWVVAAGVLCGLLFLTDYPSGAVVAVVAGWIAWQQPEAGRWSAVGLVLGVTLLVIAPWCVRNTVLAGNPVALAWQDIALRAGDPTADPVVVRGTFSADAVSLSLAKLGNKTLTAIERAFGETLWSAGAMVLAGFFVAGWLYRFRDPGTGAVRIFVAMALPLLVVTHAAFGSGEGLRDPVVTFTPLLCLFGAGFFSVLVASNPVTTAHRGWAAIGLILLQAAPLMHDLLEPRGRHFGFPPYYPALFQGLQTELRTRVGRQAQWMCDVPAGAAWYGGTRVWGQPAGLRDFYQIGVDVPMNALVLTPQTLDRPYFSDLTGAAPGGTRLGEWSQVYAGLTTRKFPAGFSLVQPLKLTNNLVVLFEPRSGTPR